MHIPTVVSIIAVIWVLLWKGLALWRAANLGQKKWYIVLLLLNTAGVLEILYLFRFAKKRLTIDEIKEWKKSLLS